MASFHLDDMMLIWIQDLAWINMVNAGHVGGYNLAKKKKKKTNPGQGYAEGLKNKQ